MRKLFYQTGCLFCASVSLLILMFSPRADAGKIRLRAREHYEWITARTETETSNFRGFSNTLNLWWEEPYQYAVGLSFSPVFANFRSNDSNPVLGKSIKPVHIGVEAKLFHESYFDHFFVRPGVSYTNLRTENNDPHGISLYLGLGYEIPIRSFGLAFEIAYRETYLQNQNRLSTLSPSIGLHFYGR